MKKKILSLVLALAVCLGLAAPALAAEGDFTIENGVLREYNGPGGDVTIPDSVTSIRGYAFYNCEILTSVTIPDSVTGIGERAFSGCKALTGVTIPGSIPEIGPYAFENCEALTSVTIPDGVTGILFGAFSGCTSLTSVTIPDGVTYIGQGAFDGAGLTSVTIPDSVTSIGPGAFGGTGLTSVIIPDGVTIIDWQTFSNCGSLTSVTIPGSVTGIGRRAFANCASLTDVYYGGSEAQWKAIKIDEYNEALANAAIHYSGSTPTTPTTPAPAVGGFSDVKEGDYFAQPVLWAVDKGVTSGTGADTFSPDQTCTVAQILTFLWRASNSPEPAGTAKLPNVDAGAYYYKPAAWAVEQGVTEGVSPDAPCTRSMVVTYLWKLAGSPGAGTGKFSDVPSNADYAQAVAWAVEQGVTGGTSETTFSPDQACTRGQIVTFLYSTFAK